MADAAPPVEAPKTGKKKPNRLLVEEATNDDNSVSCAACRFLVTSAAPARRRKWTHRSAQLTRGLLTR